MGEQVPVSGWETLASASPLRLWKFELFPVGSSQSIRRLSLHPTRKWTDRRLVGVGSKRVRYIREIGDELLSPESCNETFAHTKTPRTERQKRYSKLLKSAGYSIKLQPKGPGCNDKSLLERGANILTSLPFIVLGANTMRRAQSGERRALGAGFLCVGLSATAYHSTKANIRTVLRKADYYTISICSLLMTKALHIKKMQSMPGQTATFLSLAFTPFKPTLVTACHTAAMEVEFAKCARRHPQLRQQHRMHRIAAGIGVGCFLAEDTAIKHNIRWLHSLWHCLACYGVSSVNTLLTQKQTDLKL